MQFLTKFIPPDEFEMLERGFDLSSDHDPDEAVVSFIRVYADDAELRLTFTMGLDSSVSVVISRNDQIMASLIIEGVKSYAFQAWYGEPIISFSFDVIAVQHDLRVHYGSVPSIHYSALVTA